MKFILERKSFTKEVYLSPKEMDDEVKMICMPFIDNGFSLVASHHHGSSFYTIYKDLYRTINSFNIVNNKGWDNSNLKENSNIDQLSSQMKLLSEDLNTLSEEIEELVDRMRDFIGLEEITMSASCLIEIRIKNNPKSADEIGNYMLAGDAPSIYRN